MTALPLPNVLPRRLGAITAAGTLVGIMIGSGIFRVPSAVAALVPSPGAFMMVWLVGGLLALSGALMFGEFAAMYPDTGGRYVYLREGIHPVAAFAYAIGNILMLRPVSLSARSLLIAAYLGTLIPALAGRETLTAAAIIVVLSAMNYRSALLGAGMATGTSVAKVLALLLLIGLVVSSAPALPTVTADAGSVTLKGFGLALVTVMWTYSGWGSTTYITGEVRDASRTMPKVLTMGVGFVVVLFLLINWAYLQALPMAAIAASDTVATDAATVVLGDTAGKRMAILVVVSVLGSLTGSMLAAPRLPFAIGNDAPRLRALAKVHSAYGTPHASVLFTAVLGLLYLSAGDFEQLIENYILGSWPFYVLVAVGYFRLRIKRPDLSRPFKVPGYPVVPGFFLVASAAVVINGFAADPVGAITGSWVMLLGVPVYYLVRARAPDAIR
jgi:APA family basic amino acid/polyamine antiporter